MGRFLGTDAEIIIFTALMAELLISWKVNPVSTVSDFRLKLRCSVVVRTSAKYHLGPWRDKKIKDIGFEWLDGVDYCLGSGDGGVVKYD